MTSERFIILCGSHIEPWVANEEIFKSDRDTAVKDIAAGEYQGVSQIIAFDLEAGTCRDATREIALDVMNRLADGGEPLTRGQREFIEFHVSIRAANSFAMEEA